MSHDNQSTARGPARLVSPAEIDALGAVIDATASLAERVRSDAAGVLLRRAVALIADRRGTGRDGAERDG